MALAIEICSVCGQDGHCVIASREYLVDDSQNDLFVPSLRQSAYVVHPGEAICWRHFLAPEHKPQPTPKSERLIQLAAADALRRKADHIAADQEEMETATRMAKLPQYQSHPAALPWNAFRHLPLAPATARRVALPDPDRMRYALRHGLIEHCAASSQLHPTNCSVAANHQRLPDVLEQWRGTPILGRRGPRKPSEEMPTTNPHAWALTDNRLDA